MRLSKFLICLPPLLLCATVESAIYRCEGEHGEPSFRQRPCGHDSTVAAPATRTATGGVDGLRASEQAWLEQRERARRRPRGTERRPRSSQEAAVRAARKQAHRCRKKGRALDEVKARLRRGYKPAQGEKLRRRRRAYEDYLATFCP